MSEGKETKPNRDDIRGAIFSSNNRLKERLVFFGKEVELQQPSLGEVLKARDLGTNDVVVANMIVNFTYIPGTDERLFDESDIDQILNLPFGEDMQRMQGAISKLTGVNVGDEEKNLEGTQNDSQ